MAPTAIIDENLLYLRPVSHSGLVLTVLEVGSLDPPFLNQRPKTIVDFPEADPKLARDISLTQLRIRLEQPHQIELHFLAKH